MDDHGHSGITLHYGSVDAAYATRLATTPPEQDGPVWMVNVMSYRDRADYADGRVTALSGREADDLYAPLGPLAAVGARVVLFADVDAQFLSDEPRWDRVAVVRYPTRRSFVDMQALPEFADLHVHKDAGMDRTIILGAGRSRRRRCRRTRRTGSTCRTRRRPTTARSWCCTC